MWRTIPTLECLQQNWETLAGVPKCALVKKGIEKGLEKLHKWYMATNQTDIYFICLGKHLSYWLLTVFLTVLNSA